ncbi:MAG: phosphatidate cytidylyltransferase, partial [Hydrogenophaga sp.]|nr:phosphatidate cytidylyltransferase [Hydrogenophaga sp.]
MGSFLRSLTPEQQVSLLFVGVFGLLVLASVGAVLLSLRERHPPSDEEARRALRRHDNRALLRTSWVMAWVFWIGWALGEGVAIVLFGF